MLLETFGGGIGHHDVSMAMWTSYPWTGAERWTDRDHEWTNGWAM